MNGQQNLTHVNIATAGTVSKAPKMNTAPGKIFRVASYTLEYKGPYNSGVMASASPNSEFTFPVK